MGRSIKMIEPLRRERERISAERRSAEFAERMMAYNQRVGERFDDMWMFGDCHAIARLKTMFR